MASEISLIVGVVLHILTHRRSKHCNYNKSISDFLSLGVPSTTVRPAAPTLAPTPAPAVVNGGSSSGLRLPIGWWNGMSIVGGGAVVAIVLI